MPAWRSLPPSRAGTAQTDFLSLLLRSSVPFLFLFVKSTLNLLIGLELLCAGTQDNYPIAVLRSTAGSAAFWGSMDFPLSSAFFPKA
jgi:hypothetical protein